MDNSLIKRQAAIDALDEQIGYCDKALASFSTSAEDIYAVKVEKASLNALKETLEYLPSAEPELSQVARDIATIIENEKDMRVISERKTGRWILADNQYDEDVTNGNYRYICSECGKSDIHAKTQEVPFCWWCGTKMVAKHD